MSCAHVSGHSHQFRGVTPTETAPHVAVVGFQLQDIVQILNSLVKVLLCAQDGADSIHGGNRSWVGSKGMLIRASSLVEVADHFEKASCGSVRAEESLYLQQGSDRTNL